MMVRIFILKASVKKEACGKLYVRVGGPEAYSHREAMLLFFLNRRHWLVSSNRVTTEEKTREEKRREEKRKKRK